MAERFPGDEAAANGFGRRSLREQESWLLFQANIPAPPDMRRADRVEAQRRGSAHSPVA